MAGGIFYRVHLRLLETKLIVLIQVSPILHLLVCPKLLRNDWTCDFILAGGTLSLLVRHRKVASKKIMALKLAKIGPSNFLDIFLLLRIVLALVVVPCTLARLHQLEVMLVLLSVHTDHLLRQFGRGG